MLWTIVVAKRRSTSLKHPVRESEASEQELGTNGVARLKSLIIEGVARHGG